MAPVSLGHTLILVFFEYFPFLCHSRYYRLFLDPPQELGISIRSLFPIRMVLETRSGLDIRIFHPSMQRLGTTGLNSQCFSALIERKKCLECQVSMAEVLLRSQSSPAHSAPPSITNYYQTGCTHTSSHMFNFFLCRYF